MIIYTSETCIKENSSSQKTGRCALKDVVAGLPQNINSETPVLVSFALLVHCMSDVVS